MPACARNETQRAVTSVVGERDVVQVEMRVLRLERAPAAVEHAAAVRLHPDDPFAGARDRLGIGGLVIPVQQHRHHGGVVHVGVVRVFVLERPTARPQAGTTHRPVAGNVQNLTIRQPAAGVIVRDARLRHGVAGERGVPNRRQTGLAVGTGFVYNQ